ncbi:MAG: 4-carboxymuconolactone decarboxylase [Alphaproteobacteria bacterium]|jgi:4-carboxymuconolactone decarboxylase
MSRIPVLERDEMDAEQQRVHDAISATPAGRGRVGHGPAIGFAYSPSLWECHNATSTHQANCSLTPVQVRIVSLMTVRHWKAAYPWSAQARSAKNAGVDQAVIEAINAGEQPDFTDSADKIVHAVARELLGTGTLGDELFKSAKTTIGYRCLADVVGVISHFSGTAMMANVAGAEPPADAASKIKT